MAMQLEPRLEAAIIAYVALYSSCKARCWKAVREAILSHGRKRSCVVYRGHSRSDKTIKNVNPFFSTTPKRKMADLFVERDWEADGERVGHLFKIHLVKVPTLSTRDIAYTLTKEVKDHLKRINNNAPIHKGSGVCTLDEYMPRIRGLLRRLVHDDSKYNGMEIMVPTGGKFYRDASLSKRGFADACKGVIETWYVY
jgi:hypothetical protein